MTGRPAGTAEVTARALSVFFGEPGAEWDTTYWHYWQTRTAIPAESVTLWVSAEEVREMTQETTDDR